MRFGEFLENLQQFQQEHGDKVNNLSVVIDSPDAVGCCHVFKIELGAIKKRDRELRDLDDDPGFDAVLLQLTPTEPRYKAVKKVSADG